MSNQNELSYQFKKEVMNLMKTYNNLFENANMKEEEFVRTLFESGCFIISCGLFFFKKEAVENVLNETIVPHILDCYTAGSK